MRLSSLLPTLALVFALVLPASLRAESQAGLGASAGSGEPTLELASLPVQRDLDLTREYERFSQFAREQVERMNATILGGRSSMQVHRGADGMFHASYKAIDAAGVICQVSRANSDPHYYVGNLIYKEQVLVSAAPSAEACRKGPFEAVSEKPNRVIYTSKRGGGWQ